MVSVVNEDVVVKFPLSQPKRAWKIRTSTPKRGSRIVSIDTFFKNRYPLQRDDEFEWMVANNEIRDILAAVKEVTPQTYEEIRNAFKQASPKVPKPANFKKHHESA